jgi:hypothetical protein
MLSDSSINIIPDQLKKLFNARKVNEMIEKMVQ